MTTVVLKGSNFSISDIKELSRDGNVKAYFIYPSGENREVIVNNFKLCNMLMNMPKNTLIYD